MAKVETALSGSTASQQISAMVEPLKAIGAVLGFAVGFIATWRSGGDFAASTFHGLLGAALLFPVFWFLGLFVVREAIRVNVQEQRDEYDSQVETAKQTLATQMEAAGIKLPPALEAYGSKVKGLPSGG